MSNVFQYSQTAIDNQTVDGSDYFVEGQAASSLNNSCREVMKDIADYLQTVGCTAASGGSSNAYTLTTAADIDTLADGLVVGMVANHTCDGASTLDVDSLGAKKIFMHGGVELTDGAIRSGGHYVLSYDESADSGDGAWFLRNPSTILSSHDTNLNLLATNDGTATRVLNIGKDRSGNGESRVDLIADTTYTVYALRMMRAAGTNGTAEIVHRGTGLFTIGSKDAANVSLIANDTEVVRLRQDGFPVMAQPVALYSADTATLNGLTPPADSLAVATDGDGGSKCLALYNGATWLRIPLGAAISAT